MKKLVWLAACCMAITVGAQAADLDARTVTVQGFAAVQTKPDHATVSIGVTTSDKVTVKALDENTLLMRRVIEAMKGAGVQDKEMQTSDFSISALHPPGKSGYDVDYTVTTGYQVSNTLVVSVSDVSKVGVIIDAAVRAGANTSNAVTFNAKDQKALEDKVLADAVRDARHNAEIMAAAEGAKVGRVVSMSNSPALSFGYRPVALRMAARMESPVPVMPGEVPLAAQVTVVYGLD